MNSAAAYVMYTFNQEKSVKQIHVFNRLLPHGLPGEYNKFLIDATLEINDVQVFKFTRPWYQTCLVLHRPYKVSLDENLVNSFRIDHRVIGGVLNFAEIEVFDDSNTPVKLNLTQMGKWSTSKLSANRGGHFLLDGDLSTIFHNDKDNTKPFVESRSTLIFALQQGQDKYRNGHLN